MKTVQNTLGNVSTTFTNWYASFIDSNFRELKLAIFCFLLTAFCSFPNYNQVKVLPNNTWELIQKQIENPTVQYNINNPNSHESKRTFRLTVPIIFKLLHLKSVTLIYSFQLVLSLCFYLLIIYLCKDLYPNNSLSWILIPLAFCFVYIGQVGIVDVHAKFDSIALFCILGAMYFRPPLIIFVLSIAAAFTDERGFIALPLVYIWWQLRHFGSDKFGIKQLIIPTFKSSAVVLAGVLYLVIRYYLSQKYDLDTATGQVGLNVLKSQFNMVPFGLWSAFEGFWLIIIASIIGLILNKKYFLVSTLILLTIPSVVVSFLVLDITRSLIYCLPILIISLHLISKTENTNFINKLLLIVLFVSLLVPTYFTEGYRTIELGSRPLVFIVFKLLTP